MRILILLGVMVGSVYFYESYVDKDKLTQDLSTLDIEGTKRNIAEFKDEAVLLYGIIEKHSKTLDQIKENKNLDSQDESEQ
jgi:hypothetical protein